MSLNKRLYHISKYKNSVIKQQSILKSIYSLTPSTWAIRSWVPSLVPSPMHGLVAAAPFAWVCHTRELERFLSSSSAGPLAPELWNLSTFYRSSALLHLRLGLLGKQSWATFLAHKSLNSSSGDLKGSLSLQVFLQRAMWLRLLGRPKLLLLSSLGLMEFENLEGNCGHRTLNCILCRYTEVF